MNYRDNKKNSSGQMRQIYAYPSDEIGWRKDEQGTRLVDSLYHVLARKKCILCSVWLRHKNYFTSIPLELSRAVLLGFRLAALRLREAARWQLSNELGVRWFLTVNYRRQQLISWFSSRSPRTKTSCFCYMSRDLICIRYLHQYHNKFF